MKKIGSALVRQFRYTLTRLRTRTQAKKKGSSNDEETSRILEIHVYLDSESILLCLEFSLFRSFMHAHKYTPGKKRVRERKVTGE